MRRLADQGFMIVFLIMILAASSCSSAAVSEIPPGQATTTVAVPQTVGDYTYRVINRYPHDPEAFTQGLAFDGGVLYEGTGLNGQSSLRRVALNTGEILQIHRLPEAYFGEGITVYRDTVIQLTWQSQTGLVYNKSDFSLLRQFSYAGEGWGITHDGQRLIMSDGSSILTFLDSTTFTPVGHIRVIDGDTPVGNLNELEYVNGRIFANVWPTDRIAVIEPADGRVSGWLDLARILPTQPNSRQVDVLNGIAHDARTGYLFVTGKFWPYLFEIELVAKSRHSE